MTSAGPDGTRGVRSLADDLRGRDDAALARLLRGRPDLVAPVPTDVARLAERAARRASVARALDSLDRFHLQVVEALAVLPEPAPYAELVRLLGVGEGTGQALADALAHLHDLALLWGAPEAPRLVRSVPELLGSAPAGLGPAAATLLLGQSPGRLDRLGRLLGVASTADALAGVLADRARVQELLNDAGPAAREALTEMAWGPSTGRLPAALREVEPETARTPVEALLARGLLLPVAPDAVALPREVALHLRDGLLHRRLELVPPQPPARRLDPAGVDATAAGTAAEVVRRTERLLEAWSAQPAAALRAGGLGVRELRRASAVAELDEAATALLLETAYAAGLLAVSGQGEDVFAPTPAYDRWHRSPTELRWATLALAWSTTSRAASVVATPGQRERGQPERGQPERGQPERGQRVRGERDRGGNALGPDLDRPALPDVRRSVLQVLADAGAGVAVDPDGVRELLAWRRPRRTGSNRADLVDATLAEAAALGVTASGALAGPARHLLDLPPGATPEQPAWTAAATAVAAALADRLPPPLDHVLLQADLTAVAPGPVEPQLGRDLALLADVESTGGATVYRFSAGSVRRALDSGRTADEVLELLRRASRTPVPQPLAYLVEDVARRHGRLRVGSASAIVRSDDPAVLAEIEADPRTAALGLRRVAPTVLAARVAPQTVLDRLRDMGHVPAAESGDGTLLVSRPEPHRAPARPAPRPVLAEPPAPDEALLAAAVRAVRAGDRSARARPADVEPRPVGRTGSARLLEQLRGAADAGESVWIGYVDRDGVVTERVVDPVAVAGGWLTAYDHRTESVRTFAVHRISGVATPTPLAT